MRGITQATVLAIAMGVWLLANEEILFRTPVWTPLHKLLGTNVWIVGLIILIGGCLGALGIVINSRPISLASCAIGVFWFGCISSYLVYSNFVNQPNGVFWLSFYGLGEYIYRFVLLAPTPNADAPDVHGW